MLRSQNKLIKAGLEREENPTLSPFGGASLRDAKLSGPAQVRAQASFLNLQGWGWLFTNHTPDSGSFLPNSRVILSHRSAPALL